MSEMEIKWRKLDDVAVLDVNGEVDLSNARELEVALNELIDGHTYRVILNMARVSYMDSSGLGAVMSACADLRRFEGDLKLCGVSASIGKIFEISGVSGVVKIFASVEEALASFQAG